MDVYVHIHTQKRSYVPLRAKTLTPKILRPIFFSFLKFGHAILIRVLMLNFETSCTNRPLHNKHENAICAKKAFIEKSYNQFLVKNETGVAGIFFKF